MHSAHDEHDGDAQADDGQGAARTKAPQKVDDVSVSVMRRLSIATVAKVAALGAKARRRAKQRQRERAAYLATRKQQEKVLGIALEEKEAAAQIRREAQARHQPKLDQLRNKQQKQLVALVKRKSARGRKK